MRLLSWLDGLKLKSSRRRSKRARPCDPRRKPPGVKLFVETLEGRTLPVPAHLRDSHYQGAQEFGHGEDYKYSHDYAGGWVDQQYLPEERRYYEPTERGFEAEIKKRLEALRKKCEEEGH